jgi:streptomycin 6-kinase
MARVALSMPRRLVEDTASSGNERRRAWLAAFPGTVAEVRQRWSLQLGDPFQPGGATAWVAPARLSDSTEAVVKVGWRHDEADHEADGLRFWDGVGTVRLLASDATDDTVVLLLERCVPGTTLATQPEPEQDLVIASLLPRLWRDPPRRHPFRPLQSLCDAWADEAERRLADAATLDPGLAREGLALFRSLPRTATRDLLLATDLHAGNVLAAEREPWLMVDPKPYVGDPTYDALQHLLNCPRRLHADPRGLARRVAELLELDADRLLLWLFARCVQESAQFPSLADVARATAPRSC